jgi:protein-disulfide isomerase
MSTNSASPGGRRPKMPATPKTPASSSTPVTRQQRREAARRDQRLAAARTTAPSKPAWQSPMALITAGALVVGLLVVILASGVLNPKPAVVGNLLQPLQPTPVSLIDPANPRSLGNPSAPVKMDVWSDFQCPACDDFALNVMPQVITQYVATGKVYLTYRDFAFIDSGAANGESHQAAAAARCVGAKFWPFHDYLFENQSTTGENSGKFSTAFLASVADAVGADRTAYDACMANGAAAMVAEVNAETAQGQAAGVHQTPTVALDGKLQQGGSLPLSTLGPAIDALIPAGWTPAPSAPAASASPAGSASPAASTAP